MAFSYVSHLDCPECGKTYSARDPHHLCACGSPLLVAYHLDELKKKLSPEQIAHREPTLWYAARAGIKATIVMPVDAPVITRNECAISGANLQLVEGRISDAGKIVGQLIAEEGIYDASTLKEPYRIEGKKTMGLEIVEQFGWKLPDVILYPTGGGVGLIGIYKALKELQQLGWIDGKLPRLVAVQAADRLVWGS